MPTLKYSLERGGPRRLEISWHGNYASMRDVIIKLDGSLITVISSASELQGGKDLALPDGSTLSVISVKNRIFNFIKSEEIHVSRNGLPIPGSPADSAHLAKAAALSAYIKGFLSVLGAAVVGLGLNGERDVGLATAGALMAFSYFLTGFFIKDGLIFAHKLFIGLALFDMIVSYLNYPSPFVFAFAMAFILPVNRSIRSLKTKATSGNGSDASTLNGARSDASGFSYIGEIEQLAALRDRGILTEEEFSDKKRAILDERPSV